MTHVKKGIVQIKDFAIQDLLQRKGDGQNAVTNQVWRVRGQSKSSTAALVRNYLEAWYVLVSAQHSARM